MEVQKVDCKELASRTSKRKQQYNVETITKW